MSFGIFFWLQCHLGLTIVSLFIKKTEEQSIVYIIDNIYLDMTIKYNTSMTIHNNLNWCLILSLYFNTNTILVAMIESYLNSNISLDNLFKKYIYH